MKLLKLLFVLCYFSVGVHTVALAADDTTPADKKAETGVANSSKREDIDDEITNAKLRAATGAKSLFSFQSLFVYGGGSIQEPFSKDRLKLTAGTIEPQPSKISGAISGKYRLTDHDNINVGFGVGWLTPMYQGQRGQAEDPYIAYGRVFKALGLQNVLNVALTYYTTDYQKAIEDQYQTDIDYTVLWAVPKTKWQLGLFGAWTREMYKAGRTSDQLQDELALDPFVEYEFNNTFSFRTVYRFITYYNTTGRPDLFTRDTQTQSLGLGIAVTRDLYLYPNIQWVWADIRGDKTNVGIQANINL